MICKNAYVIKELPQTTMTIQPFRIGKYRTKFFISPAFYLEFVVIKRTPKTAVFLIDGKEYRRKIHMDSVPHLAYTNIPDPYDYNWDAVSHGESSQIVGRLAKPYDRNIDWRKCERID